MDIDLEEISRLSKVIQDKVKEATSDIRDKKLISVLERLLVIYGCSVRICDLIEFNKGVTYDKQSE